MDPNGALLRDDRNWPELRRKAPIRKRAVLAALNAKLGRTCPHAGSSGREYLAERSSERRSRPRRFRSVATGRAAGDRSGAARAAATSRPSGDSSSALFAGAGTPGVASGRRPAIGGRDVADLLDEMAVKRATMLGNLQRLSFSRNEMRPWAVVRRIVAGPQRSFRTNADLTTHRLGVPPALDVSSR